MSFQHSNGSHGVVACFSGQPEDIKKAMDDVITQLGGSSVGRFDPRCVTHLILQSAAGSKYESYVKHKHTDWARKLSIVHTSWVHACDVAQAHVCEDEHRVYGIETDSIASTATVSSQDNRAMQDANVSSPPADIYISRRVVIIIRWYQMH